MNQTAIAGMLSRIDAVWPPKTPPTDAERAEWVKFLLVLDVKVAERGMDILREQLRWRPSLADFRSAYNEGAKLPDPDVKALPPAPGATPTDYSDLYGQRQDEWVYCWKCDMAITLEERCGRPLHHSAKGMFHHRCPRSGTVPVIPVHLRIERDDYFRKKRL